MRRTPSHWDLSTLVCAIAAFRYTNASKAQAEIDALRATHGATLGFGCLCLTSGVKQVSCVRTTNPKLIRKLFG